MIKYFKIFVVGFLISLIGFPNSHASRRYMPMGNVIQDSELIVIADAKGEGQYGLVGTILIKEVLKGDPKLKGSELAIPSTGRLSTADVHLPKALNMAVLFKKNWSSQKDSWPIVEVYQKNEDLAALRSLVKVYKEPDERKRLLALWKIFPQRNVKVQEQFFIDIRDMKNPDNFGIMIDAYDCLNVKHQRQLIEVLGDVGDSRAVPTLIKAMLSGSKEVSVVATGKLYYFYPGAPGVIEAFKQVSKNDDLKWYADRYLAAQTNNPELKKQLLSKETRFLKAERLKKEGKQEEVKKIYFEQIEGPDEFPQADVNNYSRRQAAASLLPTASLEEKDRIRKALLPMFMKDASADNWLNANEAAIIMRSLKHLDCLPALMVILHKESRIDWEAAQTATMAIHELGEDARRKAVQQILEWIKVDSLLGYQSNPQRYLLELIWLADEEEIIKAEFIMRPQYKQNWNFLSVMHSLNKQQDEVLFLINILESKENIGQEPQQWILARLGDLKDPRSVGVLAKLLGEHVYSMSPQIIVETLVKIAGPKVEEEMMKLLSQEDNKDNIKQYPAEVMFRIKGATAIDLARRMMSEKNFGSKQNAMMFLSRFGTPEDLKILIPLCDYWKSDRSLHYWAMSAVAEIRTRYNYDMNGKVEESKDFSKK